MSPVRRHFWQLVALVNSSFTFPKKWSLNGFMPAGVNRTEGSQRGTSTSLGRRACPFDSKKARYFSRSSSVFMGFCRNKSHPWHLAASYRPGEKRARRIGEHGYRVLPAVPGSVFSGSRPLGFLNRSHPPDSIVFIHVLEL